METKMFCYQCEQTAGGTGCDKNVGVCGKDAQSASLMDLLVYSVKGISMYADRARNLTGAQDKEIDTFVIDALFITTTNVNFDAQRIASYVTKAQEIRAKAKAIYENACKDKSVEPEDIESQVDLKVSGDLDEMTAQAEKYSILNSKETFGDDITALQELLTYGLKGTAAYANHARILGQEDDEVYGFFHEALNFLTGPNNKDLDELVTMCLRCGEVNLKTMGLLDAANTGAYGNPEPTKVRITPIKGKAILVSGHDLKDLHTLLKQTEGKGINVYTHGEMLPCLAYPQLKAYKHLVGNYGGAWQDQRKEFDQFPGSILMTTNCIQQPKDTYKARIFTTGLVGWPGVEHVGNEDFTPVIEAALAADGFDADAEEKFITIGFGHAAVMNVAGTIIDAVKSGAIKHFFLIGGCDGAKPGRNYYTELAEQIPDDCVIMTLACGKYRFNKLEFGDIGGIPRLLDIGQCNDAYSAVQIAVALAEAFECGVNDLPLSFVLSWYEQKAICILLSLLHLGIQNIRIGPSLPAFITPAVLDVLVKNFNIMPVSTPEADLKAMLEA